MVDRAAQLRDERRGSLGRTATVSSEYDEVLCIYIKPYAIFKQKKNILDECFQFKIDFRMILAIRTVTQKTPSS